MSGIDKSYGDDRGFRPNSQVSNFLARRSGLLAVLLVIVIFGGAIWIQGFARVPAGYRGVLLTWGKVEERILPEGLSFIIPFVQSAELMNVQVQKAESTESTATNDLQEITTTVAVNFRLRPNAVNEIYRELRQDYVSRVIKPNIEESLKAATALYKAEALIQQRAIVKATFDDILAERLDVFGIDVIAVSLTDFQFSPSFSAAIEAKVTAEQQALEAKNKLEQVRYEAQQQIIQAEAEKNATIARAEGQAEAAIIEADATARSIELITSQMTPEYAQYLWLRQWDGKLPAVVGEGQGFIIDLSTLTGEGG
ncbi:MAG: prohibitin family protein [Candidatus Bathyarchaeota archaeon]|jgi:regulator of protease activity HflC (stomatin/prohibitin superfamily)|nr:prohibitin family protein [Candidatus Bathyarchaeota archaeon]